MYPTDFMLTEAREHDVNQKRLNRFKKTVQEDALDRFFDILSIRLSLPTLSDKQSLLH